MDSRPCAHCGAEFTPKRPWGRFCSKRCRWADRPARRREQDAKLRELARAFAKEVGLTVEDFA